MAEVAVNRLLVLRTASEVLLLLAMAGVVATDAVGSTGGNTLAFAATNAFLGVFAWLRPRVGGWVFVALAGVMASNALLSDAYLDRSTVERVGIVALWILPPLLVGILFLAAGRAAQRSRPQPDAAKVYWRSPSRGALVILIATMIVGYGYVLLASLLERG